MSNRNHLELLNDPRLTLSPEEYVALSLMKPKEMTTLVEYLLQNGFFGVDCDHGPEPELTHFYEKLCALPDRDHAIYN